MTKCNVLKPCIRKKNGKLSDLERGMVVGARQAGLNISENADLLKSRTRITRVYIDWSKTEISSTVIRFPSNNVPLGCGGTGDSHHESD